jgi:uncharacterized protein YkwD
MRDTNQRPLGLTVTVILIVGVLATACNAVKHPTAADSVHAAADVQNFASETAFCVSEINRLRATIGAAPLARTDRLENFATEAARVDTEEGVPHTHFRRTNGGNGTAFAENTIPWWKMSSHGSVRNVIREGLQQMWAQGPGGTHYENMRGNYTEVGCGVFTANGEVTISQDFR